VDRGIVLLLSDLGTRRGCVDSTTPERFTPGKKAVPLYRRLGGPQGQSERVRKISPHRVRSPDRPARIPTELPSPPHVEGSIILKWLSV
jgi:hypothetical protein